VDWAMLLKRREVVGQVMVNFARIARRATCSTKRSHLLDADCSKQKAAPGQQLFLGKCVRRPELI